MMSGVVLVDGCRKLSCWPRIARTWIPCRQQLMADEYHCATNRTKYKTHNQTMFHEVFRPITLVFLISDFNNLSYQRASKMKRQFQRKEPILLWGSLRIRKHELWFPFCCCMTRWCVQISMNAKRERISGCESSSVAFFVNQFPKVRTSQISRRHESCNARPKLKTVVYIEEQTCT